MLGSAAADAGRRVRILERQGQSADHPVLLNVPETALPEVRYLPDPHLGNDSAVRTPNYAKIQKTNMFAVALSLNSEALRFVFS